MPGEIRKPEGASSKGPANESAHKLLLTISVLVLLWMAPRAWAQTLYLLKDLNTVPASTGSIPTGLVTVGDWVFFDAGSPGRGTELWVTDGTRAGTHLVKDMLPGEGSGRPGGWRLPIVAQGDSAFFVAETGASEWSLCRTDGSEESTTILRSFIGYYDFIPQQLSAVGSTVFFVVCDDDHGVELWKSNGTPEGTVIVKDICPGPQHSFPSWLTSSQGALYFFAWDGVHNGLWRSDGTSQGTKLVKEIETPEDMTPPQYLVDFSGNLYFSSWAGANNTSIWQLWRSDGTSSGTVVVSSVPMPQGPGVPGWFTIAGHNFFFTAFESGRGHVLWKSDGTSKGTGPIVTIDSDLETATPPVLLAGHDGKLFFIGDDGVSGRELWLSDGTEQGTRMVADINPGPSSSAGWFARAVLANGALFFFADDGAHDFELWKSDGTRDGTVLVRDVREGVGSLFEGANGRLEVPSLVAIGGKVLFGANDGRNGLELWSSDGTSSGTAMVADIYPSVGDSDPQGFTELNGQLFFTAFTADSGWELWRTDAKREGTALLIEINPGSASAYPYRPTRMGGALLFAADDGVHGSELWRSDGAPEGTTMVKDINPGSATSRPFMAVAAGNKVFLVADDGLHGCELWVSDGTSAGTHLVKDIRPGSEGSLCDDYREPQLVRQDSRVFFVADDGISGRELWRSDGTEAGTVLVSDLSAGPSGTYFSALTVFGGAVFFAAAIGPSCIVVEALWTTDGTEAGTRFVTKEGGYSPANPRQLTVVGDTLYFSAYDSSTGEELWKLGTGEQHATLVADVAPGTESSYPSRLFSANGTLLFFADDGSHGFELWRSSGTAATTTLVWDINPGAGPSRPWRASLEAFAAVAAKVIFIANDGSHGEEPWVYDRVTGQVALVADLNPGSASSLLDGLTPFGPRVLFAAYSPTTGKEPWAIDTDGCELACLTLVPAHAAANAPVGFASCVGLNACAGEPVYTWTFGDGTADGGGSEIAHVYTMAGVYRWSLVVTLGAATCVRYGSVEIHDAPTIGSQWEHVYFVPSSAHTQGAFGSIWVTDLVIHNPNEVDQSARVFFLGEGNDNRASFGRRIEVAAGQSSTVLDAVSTLFDEKERLGALVVTCQRPLLVTSRTYARSSEGTYGQLFEGLPENDALAANQEGRLLQLARSRDYRTNLGIANASGTPVDVVVKFFLASGQALGQKLFRIGPFGFHQENDVLAALGADVPEAYAIATSTTSSVRYFVYASVIDNRTNDPIAIVPARASATATPSAPVWVVGAGHLTGLAGTNWRTDLEVHNPGSAPLQYSLSLLRRGEDGSAPATRELSLQPGSSARLRDVVQTVFGAAGAATLRLAPSTGEILVTSRTYNEQPSGTFGQLVPGQGGDDLIGFGEEARIVCLARSVEVARGFRTNLGLSNGTGSPAEVTVDLFLADGRRLGRRTYSLRPYESIQRNDVFGEVTNEDVAAGYVIAHTATAGGRFLASASLVDNLSGDPTWLPARTTPAGDASPR
jgi:ELWxxDGT repeat protein